MPEVVSAAAAQGYNTKAAFWCAFLWSLAIIGGSVVLAWRARAPEAIQTGAPTPTLGRLRWPELAIVFAVFAFAYFALFLARTGPFIEDQYFLTSISRMNCGQIPFRDFEFLYGPLMIVPLRAWSQVFGVSMTSYYSALALLEGLQFALLMGVLQLFIPDRRQRTIVFLLLLPFLINTLMGLNWNGMRRLVPVLTLLLIAWRPFDWRATVVAGVVLGLHLGYSHEYASAALIGIAAIYALSLLIANERILAIRSGLTVALLAVATWALSTVLAMGSAWHDYITTALGILDLMASGHAAFKFYWTVNSLAVFGLLTLACVAVGASFARRWGPMRAGDRMFVGSVAFALVMIKSGLTRADLWHVNSISLALMFAFLLPLPMSVVTLGDKERRWAMGLMAVAAVTYFVGIMPTGSLYAFSYLQGFADTVTGKERLVPDAAASRIPSLEYERSRPNPDFIAMGRYLAAPERKDKSVLFYGRAWVIAPRVGVCSEDYKLDDLMYSELSRPERLFLEKHPDALVVMRRMDYERIYGLADPNAPHYPMELTITKQLGRWLSTVHYDAAETEFRIQDEARDGNSGVYIHERYGLAAAFKDFVVLAPKAEGLTNP